MYLIHTKYKCRALIVIQTDKLSEWDIPCIIQFSSNLEIHVYCYFLDKVNGYQDPVRSIDI